MIDIVLTLCCLCCQRCRCFCVIKRPMATSPCLCGDTTPCMTGPTACCTRCMQGVLEADSGSGSGEMEAGLQMDTVALVLLELGVMEAPGGGGEGPSRPLA